MGHLFISADYRLVPPATGHDILDDIRELWSFITDPGLVLEFPPENLDGIPLCYTIRREDVIVAGTSAGGLCAYLAAGSCNLSPPPKALLSMYGMGGDFLVTFSLSLTATYRC